MNINVNDKTTNKHYSVTRACADGVSQLKMRIHEYFNNHEMESVVKTVVGNILNSPNIDDTRRDMIKTQLPIFDASVYYLKQVLGMFPICANFYNSNTLQLERYRQSEFSELYYTFRNNQCITEINVASADATDILELVISRTRCIIRNTKNPNRVRHYTIKKTYIVENEVPSLYNIIIINNEKYLIEYGLVGIHILETTISSLIDIENGWDNTDVYLIPFYPYIKKIYDIGLVNGKIGVYKTKIYRIKNDVKLPSKMTTVLSVDADFETTTEQLDDFYITSAFIKKVKSNVDKPLLTDDELLDLFGKSTAKRLVKPKNKSKRLVKPLYVPVALADTSVEVVNDTSLTTLYKVPSLESLFKVTYNKKYIFDNENVILMNNYTTNPRVKQLLDEYDEIVFIKPIERHYNTKYRYFNICLKTDIRRSNQYHIHLNNDGRVYSITEIRDLIN